MQNGLLRQAVLLFKEVFSMATTRLMPLATCKGRTVGQAISDIIDYTENPQKTDGGRLITSWQCDSRITADLNNGRGRQHLVLSPS